MQQCVNIHDSLGQTDRALFDGLTQCEEVHSCFNVPTSSSSSPSSSSSSSSTALPSLEEGKKGLEDSPKTKGDGGNDTAHHHQSNSTIITSPSQRGQPAESASKNGLIVKKDNVGIDGSSSITTQAKEAKSRGTALTQKGDGKNEREEKREIDERRDDALDDATRHEQQRGHDPVQKTQHVSKTSIVESHSHQHEKTMGGRSCDDICEGYCNGKDGDCSKRCGVACFGERFIVRF
mmetsp:Transcript_10085/g.13895  ORF Transcript_10085/g.13895 Transcript_10085/m.13895 type:complete len:235 (-) Transcript_10085:106-810(-)